MNRSKKRIYILLIALVLLITCGLVVNRHINKADILNGNPDTEIKTDEKMQSGLPAEKEKKAGKTIKFKTNDDIKIRYGKIEEVYLYNGKKYEGAVLTTDEFYTIVTVDGTFKIPMQEVKLRNIIR